MHSEWRSNLKAQFIGNQQEFDEFYQRFKAQQQASNDEVIFTFEVDPHSDFSENNKQISLLDESPLDDGLDENDIFHSNNREWLKGQLAEADEDIKARRVVPASKALFEDIIARGKARLKESSQ